MRNNKRALCSLLLIGICGIQNSCGALGVSIPATGSSGSGTGSTSGGPTSYTFTSGLAATYVIGQANMTTGSTNQGGSVAANTFDFSNGTPAVVNKILYISDYNSNRVLGFNTVPSSNNVSADFVLGQTIFTTSASGSGNNQLSKSTTIASSGSNLAVVDSGNNRILLFDVAPTASQPTANVVVGTGASGASQNSFSHPQGVSFGNSKMVVADSQSNRVLIWNNIPTLDAANADLVLGQTSFNLGTVNGGVSAAANTLSDPVNTWTDGKKLAVADCNNNRVLIWNNFSY